jgi:hypothetical protein
MDLNTLYPKTKDVATQTDMTIQTPEYIYRSTPIYSPSRELRHQLLDTPLSKTAPHPIVHYLSQRLETWALSPQGCSHGRQSRLESHDAPAPGTLTPTGGRRPN